MKGTQAASIFLVIEELISLLSFNIQFVAQKHNHQTQLWSSLISLQIRSPLFSSMMTTKHTLLGLHNHLCVYFSRIKTRPFTTCPLLAEEATPADHKALCFSLAQNLIARGMLDSAQKVIHRIIKQSSSPSEAISAVEFSINHGVEPDQTTYAFLIRKLVTSGQTNKAEDFFVDFMLNRGIKPHDSVFNSMVICYCNLGKLEAAKFCFDELVTPCSGAYNELINGFCGQERVLDGYGVFEKAIKAEVLLRYRCYNKLVDGLCYQGYLNEAIYVFGVLYARGIPPTVHLFKTLVFSLCKWGRVEKAQSLSMEMEFYGFYLDKVTYTALINGHCKNQKMKMAMMVFLRMLKLGCEPDKYTYNTLINGFFDLGMFDKGWELLQQMGELGVESDAVSYEIMIGKYCKHHKVDFALELFDVIIQGNVSPSVHSYTALIGALCKEDRLAEVADLYKKMLGNGLVPDQVLFFILINYYPRGSEISLACAHEFLQAIAKNGCGIDLSYVPSPSSTTDIMLDIDSLLEEIVARNLNLASVAFNIYMTALCLGGELDSALVCMEKMGSLSLQPSQSAYNSMIKCLCQKELFEDAKSLVEAMRDQRQVPKTFLIMVNEYCKQGDDIQSACEVLGQTEESGLEPSIALL